MATSLGIREVRDSFTQVMRRVRAGETIEVTLDGEPVAVIAPLTVDPVDRLLAEGKIRPPLSPLELPEPLEQSGIVSASEALQDDRGD